MKDLFSFFGGAVKIQEQGGDFFLAFDGSLGGGEAAGLVEGQGKLKLGAGSVGLKLAEHWVNQHAPAYLQPFLQAGEAFLNGAVAGA